MWNLLQAKIILAVVMVTSAVAASEDLAKSGTFAINDSGVQGEGTFTFMNGIALINLSLFLGKETGKGTVTISNATAANITNSSLNQKALSSADTSQNLGADGNYTEDRQPTVGGESTTRMSGDRGNLSGHMTDDKKKTENRPSGENLESIAPSSGGGRPPVSHVRIVAVDEQPTFKEMQFSDEDMKFMDEALEAHNKFRKIHDAPPMILNREMSLDAKRFAEKLAKESDLKHSSKNTRPDQGENLAMGCSTDDPPITPSAAVKKWYDEVCKYNFANAAFQKPAGHFSQVVWKPSIELGLGTAAGSKWGMKCTFIVARYRVKGNVDTGNNDFAKNVKKGSFDPAYCSLIDNEDTSNGFKSAPTVASPSLGEIRNYPEYTGYNEGIYENGSHAQFRGKIPRPAKGFHRNAARRGPPKKERNQKRTRVQIL